LPLILPLTLLLILPLILLLILQLILMLLPAAQHHRLPLPFQPQPERQQRKEEPPVSSHNRRRTALQRRVSALNPWQKTGTILIVR
jgi:hypothetical protein